MSHNTVSVALAATVNLLRLGVVSIVLPSGSVENVEKGKAREWYRRYNRVERGGKSCSHKMLALFFHAGSGYVARSMVFSFRLS